MLIENILQEYYLGTNFVLMTPEFNDRMFLIPNRDYTIKGQTTTYRGKLKLNSRVINKFAGPRTPIAQLKSFPEEIYASASDDMKAAIKKATSNGVFVNFRSIPGNKVVVRVWDPETWNMLPQSTNRFLMNTTSFKKLLATEVEEISIDVNRDGEPDGPKPKPKPKPTGSDPKPKQKPKQITFNIRDSRGTPLNKNDKVQYKSAKNYPATGVKKGDLITGTIIGLTGDKYRAKTTGKISQCSGNQVLVKGSRGQFCKDAKDLIKVS